MQKKLDDILEGQLLIRVHISRETALFSKRQLADGFDISIATLHRYTSPAYRELSRVIALKAHYEKREGRMAALKNCHRCGGAIENHQKCNDCKILMHDRFQSRCQSCFDSAHRAKVYA
jgi:hypothetical protein